MHESFLGGERVEVDAHDDRIVPLLLRVPEQLLVAGLEQRQVLEAAQGGVLAACTIQHLDERQEWTVE